MQNYSMMLPHYSIGAEIYDNIPKFCLPHGRKIVAIGGHTAMNVAKPEIDRAIEGSGLEIIDYIWYGGEASYENVEMLLALPQVQEADMIFAIGGGKALDTCKC